VEEVEGEEVEGRERRSRGGGGGVGEDEEEVMEEEGEEKEEEVVSCNTNNIMPDLKLIVKYINRMK
jgi:hypothetical protein